MAWNMTCPRCGAKHYSMRFSCYHCGASMGNFATPAPQEEPRE